MVQYLVLVVVCVIGAMLQATIGFGFPVFAMIFFPLVFPFSTAVTICQFAGLLSVAYFSIKYRQSIRWKILIPFLIPALTIGVVFTWYSASFPVAQLKLALGFVLLGIAALLIISSSRFKMQSTPLVGGVMGVFSGVLNGLFAIGGPPVALYLLPAIGEKIAYIATANTYFLFFKFFSLPIRFTNGSITSEHIGFLLVSLVSMTVGTLVGDKIMRKVPKTLLEKLVYIFVGFSGLVIIIQELV